MPFLQSREFDRGEVRQKARVGSFVLQDLSAAVDVYSDWVDACDAVAKDTASKYEADDLATRASSRTYSPEGRGIGVAEHASDFVED
ncbi:uncharacterized protein BDW70DRAFT_160933 [Aspergillus foveolatus]|uniref:uncharacterized protein n=1 Tax=Aspergillus foveolatus TaxID=210207 RepID=UPI003CCE3379